MSTIPYFAYRVYKNGPMSLSEYGCRFLKGGTQPFTYVDTMITLLIEEEAYPEGMDIPKQMSILYILRRLKGLELLWD